MQVFRGLDVGTAKATAAEQAGVRHHLIDVVDPGEPFDSARWLALAKAAFDEVRRRGRVAVFCGGTGLYFNAWFRGLDAPAPSDPAVRAELESLPLAELLRELEALDPGTFARIDQRNPRRVVRALEIIRLTNEPIARPVPQADPEGAAGGATTIVVLRRTPEDLRARIDWRVDQMFRDGLVEEARGLMERGLGQDRTAMQAIGYRQVVEHLRGERDLASTIALVKTRTWQFARRQMTWFRHQLPVTWLDVDAAEGPEGTAGRVLDQFTNPWKRPIQ